MRWPVMVASCIALGPAALSLLSGCGTGDSLTASPYCTGSKAASGFAATGCGERTWEADARVASRADLEALRGYTRIAGNLHIENSSVADLSGLDSLACIDGDLLIRGNRTLQDLRGLDALQYVGGNLTVGDQSAGNAALAELAGLGRLTTVEGHVWIQGNPRLADLDELDHLRFIGDFLGLFDNATLTRVDMPRLAHLGLFLNVAGNPALPTCAATALHAHLAAPCRNTCIRNNQPDTCTADREAESCWYEGADGAESPE